MTAKNERHRAGDGPDDSAPRQGDLLVRALIDDGAARLVIAVATGVAREAARRHDAGPAAAVAMGRAATAGLLLATLTKDDERVTLQLLGKGPLGTLTVDAGSGGTARVFVTNPRFAMQGSGAAATRVGDAVGRSGVVNVVRDLGPGHDFSGQTPIIDGEIDTDVEHYLCQSEQIDSALACEARLDQRGGIRLAVGVLVQALPNNQTGTLRGFPYPPATTPLGKAEWSSRDLGARVVAEARARLRAGALHALPDDPDIATIIEAALGDSASEARVLPGELPLRFHCPCSRERAAATLALLGEEDLLALIREEGEADVTCEFCRAHYAFTDAALEGIRQGIRRDIGPPS